MDAEQPADALTDPPPDRVVAILLAAGAGTRFRGDRHKLMSRLPADADRPAESVAARSLAALRSSAIGPIVVVTGAVDVSSDVGTEVRNDTADNVSTGAGTRADAAPDIEFVPNPNWADGQITSLHAGLDAARRHGAARVVVGLADQPGITADTWRAVAAAGAGASIAVATYDGRRGNPVALRSDCWDLLPTSGDEGARSLMRVRPDLVIEVPCSGSSDDIDTTEDLRRWQNNSSTNSP